MDSATYQLLNLICAAMFCGVTGLVLGFGWGRESAFDAVRNALIADEAARANGFRRTFEAGINSDVKTKKEASQNCEATIK